MVQKKTNFLDTVPIHPLLFGVYPVLALWLVNIDEIPANSILRTLVLSLAITAGLLIIFLGLTRRLTKAALLTSLVVFTLFAYGHVFSFIDHQSIGGFIIGRHRFIIPLWLGLMTTGIILIWRVQKPVREVTSILNIVSIFLVAFVSVQIAFDLAGKTTTPDPQTPLPADTSEEGRDVYYIVLDSYARGDVLLQEEGLDNRGFLQKLESLGFVVNHCALSNYDTTTISMASSLNMDYLEELGVPIQPEADDIDVKDVENLLKNSQVRAVFQNMGYQFVTFKALYPWMDISDSDIYLDSQQSVSAFNRQESVNFYYLFLETTILRPMLEIAESTANQNADLPPFLKLLLNPVSSREFGQFLQNQYAFEKLEELPLIAGKKFIYAHLFSTHQPFTYNQNGTFRVPTSDSAGGDYYNAVLFTNSRILGIIQTILRSSKTPPIIILQGDHNIEVSSERGKILNAYYMPEGGQKNFIRG